MIDRDAEGGNAPEFEDHDDIPAEPEDDAPEGAEAGDAQDEEGAEEEAEDGGEGEVEEPKPDPAPKRQEERIPLSLYRQTRAELQEMRAEVARLRTAREPAAETQDAPKLPEIPDMYEDPQGFVAAIKAHAVNESRQQARAVFDAMRREERAASADASFRQIAAKDRAAFDAAYAAAEAAVRGGDSALPDRIARAANPGEFLLRWHKAQRFLDGDEAALRPPVPKEARKPAIDVPSRTAPPSGGSGQRTQPGNKLLDDAEFLRALRS